MPRNVLMAALFAALLPCGGIAQTAVPLIAVTPTDGGLAIAGIVAGVSEGTVNAEMTIARTDGSGSTRTRQSHDMNVSPASCDAVAMTNLSTGDGLHVKIVLVIRENDLVIASAQTEIGSDD